MEEIDRLGEGSVFVLAPKTDQVETLNFRRQIFADRKFKVVLWCDEATTVAFARKAVDLFDWVSHRQECPSGPAPFAVRGFRAAFEAQWPVVWNGSERKEDLEEALRAVFPQETISVFDGADPYDQLVEHMSLPEIIIVHVPYARALRRVRWAYAESKRQGRLVLVAPGLDCPGFWPVHDRYEDLGKAIAVLEEKHATTPGAFAALLELEPEAIEYVAKRLVGGVQSADLIEAVGEKLDPTTGLARYVGEEFRTMDGEQKLPSNNPFLLRAAWVRWRAKNALLRRIEENAGFDGVHYVFKHGLSVRTEPTDRAWIMEQVLRHHEQPGLTWIALAIAAESLGDATISSRWLSRSAIHYPGSIGALRENIEKAARDHFHHNERIQYAGLGASVYFPLCCIMLAALGALDMVVSWGAWRKNGFLGIWFVVLGTLGAWSSRILGSYLRKRYIEAPGWEDLAEGRFLDFEEENAEAIRQKLGKAKTLRDQDSPDTASFTRETLEFAQAKLGLEHPLTEEVAQFLAQLLLDTGPPRDAWTTVEPLLWPDREMSAELAFLTARILARTGRTDIGIRILARLTGETIAATNTLLPSTNNILTPDESFSERLLQCPANALARDPGAFLVLVDALLAQGRYPEALSIARKASTTFSQSNDEASAELAARVIDLERRQR